MIIKQNDKRLIEAGHTEVTASDQWSLTVRVTGLDRKTGVPVHCDLVMSRNEIAMLASVACREG